VAAVRDTTVDPHAIDAMCISSLEEYETMVGPVRRVGPQWVALAVGVLLLWGLRSRLFGWRRADGGGSSARGGLGQAALRRVGVAGGVMTVCLCVVCMLEVRVAASGELRHGYADFDWWRCAASLMVWPAREPVVPGDTSPLMFPMSREIGNVECSTWSVLVPLAGVAAVCLWLGRGRAVRAGCCRRCGYDLTGNVSGRCSECGAEGIEGSREDT
jgi:hypothetical protein